MKLKPLDDKIVVKMCEADETTKSGIILTGAKEKPQIAEVIAVGPGGIVDGRNVLMTVSVGDKIVMNKYSGSEVKLDNDEFVIIKLSDVLAIVE